MKTKSTRSTNLTRLARIVCQSVFFALFLILLFRTRSSGTEPIGGVDGFFHFDPLLGLATALASRTLQAAYAFALVTILVTLLFGRYVCGWVCPLGSLLHFFSFLFAKLRWAKPRLEKNRHLRWKYLILVFVLVASLFTLDFAGYLDPLSFLYRSFSTAVLPGAAVSSAAGADLLHKTGIAVPQRWTEFSRNLMIGTVFRQGALIGAIFLGVILLNLVRPRFWCRYVCPAGAMLGVIARWHPVKLRIAEDKCDSCRVCSLQCPSHADPHLGDKWKRAECFHCYNCVSHCPREGISFPLAAGAATSPGIDLSRRELVLSSTLGVLSAPLLVVSAAERPSEKLIRPPGALPEPQFLSKCIRCGECMKVCPTNGLQYAYNEGSVMAFWTPVLAPRIGFCDYECSLCGQVCPTGAIRELALKQKRQVRIGAAWVRKDRCLPYSVGETCRVCEAKCPTSPKAVIMVDTEYFAPEGKIPLQAPIVDPELCIGCGICENRCPVEDESGIYCTSYGESRSEKNNFSAPPQA